MTHQASDSHAALLTETGDYLHRQIPLSRAMGVRVQTYDGETLTLTAPAELNHNHLGTAFGGSLSALATLAGYGLLWLELGNRDSHIVIRRSRIHYLRPVHGELRAVCLRPAAEVVTAFKAKFARVGKARITLGVTVEADGGNGVEFEGEYVALR
ncbi:MAG: thioesterase [Verrucomicrobiales bacterium]|nr:thioesterase [Verrucomicrobiales bacterium]